MKPALLLVDLQGDFLDSNGLQPSRENLVSQTAALLHDCRRKNIPVIHLWTTVERANDRRLPHWKKHGRWLCVAGTDGHKTPAPLQPLANETVIPKAGFNGFAGGELDAVLQKLGCDTVILAGLHLHTCVRTAAAESLERGLRVFMRSPAMTRFMPPPRAAGLRNAVLNLLTQMKFYRGSPETRRPGWFIIRLVKREKSCLKFPSPARTKFPWPPRPR
ncbi:MAG: isochorismatase family cysteine hydrolase [Verrucomicrobiota bacterium]